MKDVVPSVDRSNYAADSELSLSLPAHLKDTLCRFLVHCRNHVFPI